MNLIFCIYSLTIAYNNLNVSTTNQTTQSQITHFYDANNDWVYDKQGEFDPTFSQATADDTSLENFFKRPIKVLEFPWEINTDVLQQFDIWSAYITNKRVANRLTNFNNLRANLCTKITVNGNGFYYGRMLVSYVPNYAEDELSLFDSSKVYKIPASQRPHIYLDPTTSQGGQMKLPYIWKNDYMSLPEGDFTNFGLLVLETLTTLQHANGATDSISVSIFAWLEDVTLATPTSQNILGLTPQSGDEYSCNPVSTPALAVAGAAKSLSILPGISKYAMATSQIATMTAAVAKLFGFARPAVVQDIVPFKPTFGNFANTTAADAVAKLTFDAKQEVTIDSRVVGLDGTDEMSMKYFLTRESYITWFPWLTSNLPEDCLWSTYVTPKIFDTSSLPLGRAFHMTPICYGSAPFVHWRGSIKYRFQIVCSSFHKGRLKIVYDPYKNASNEYNTNYTRIVDISSERDFTITVGWGNQAHFLDFGDFDGQTAVPFELGTITTPKPTETNGVLSVYVVNDLTVPNSTVPNDIEINVFVSAGDDYEVANPDDAAQGYFSIYPPSNTPGLRLLEPQSGEEQGATMMSSAPVIDTPLSTIANLVPSPSDTYKVFFGDPVGSIRQVIKRYNYHSLVFYDPESTEGMNWYEAVRNDFPFYFGASATGVYDTTDGKKNYAKMTMLNWFTPCYVCRRGGLRWKYVALPLYTDTGLDVGSLTKNLQVRRVPHYRKYRYGSYGLIGDYADVALVNARTAGNIWAGGIMHNTNNQTVEVELPYHTSRRFYACRDPDMITDNTGSLNNTSFHEVNAATVGFPGRPMAMGYVAAADDFSLSFFLSVPLTYYHDPNGPTP